MRVWKYYGPRQIKLKSAPKPAIGPGDVLVRVLACGICSTDAKTYVRGHPKIRPPAVLGHELVGVVEEVQGDQGLRQGDRVVVAPYAPCGRCAPCRRGEFTLCRHLFDIAVEPGGFSELVRVPAPLVQKGVYALPDAMPVLAGTLVEPLACCCHALEALAVGPETSLLILGDGPMAILQAEAARALGAAPIIMSGITPQRLARGGRAAHYTVDSRKEDVGRVVARVTGSQGADAVIVSVGNVVVAESALAMVRPGGRINLFAGMSEGSHFSVDPNRIHYSEVHLLGTFGFAPHHFRQALHLLATGQVDVDGIITHVIPFEEVEQGLEAVANYQGIKTVVVTEIYSEAG